MSGLSTIEHNSHSKMTRRLFYGIDTILIIVPIMYYSWKHGIPSPVTTIVFLAATAYVYRSYAKGNHRRAFVLSFTYALLPLVFGLLSQDFIELNLSKNSQKTTLVSITHVFYNQYEICPEFTSLNSLNSRYEYYGPAYTFPFSESLIRDGVNRPLLHSIPFYSECGIVKQCCSDTDHASEIGNVLVNPDNELRYHQALLLSAIHDLHVSELDVQLWMEKNKSIFVVETELAGVSLKVNGLRDMIVAHQNHMTESTKGLLKSTEYIERRLLNPHDRSKDKNIGLYAEAFDSLID